jgi:hypothetical protein
MRLLHWHPFETVHAAKTSQNDISDISVAEQRIQTIEDWIALFIEVSALSLPFVLLIHFITQ